MESIYGHIVTSDDDEYLDYAEAALKGTTEVASPGAAIVDVLPFRELCCARLMRFKPNSQISQCATSQAGCLAEALRNEAAKVKISIEKAHAKPYEMVQKAMVCVLIALRPEFRFLNHIVTYQTTRDDRPSLV